MSRKQLAPSTPAAPGSRGAPDATIRRGLVLILVLVVIAMLSLGAYTFTDLMLAHHDAAIQTGRQVQTRALLDSGVEAVRLFLALPEVQRIEAGGVFDNPTRFGGITILPNDDPADRGSYSVISPNIDAEGNMSGVRHGLEDESTRLNLNTLLFVDQLMPGAGRTLLMALPGMTEDIADAILDWIDTDDTPREFGAEVDYYSGLNPPYAPKNGPLDTVEELLLVRGVTPDLLFGADVNRNGQLDAHEANLGPSGATDPASFRGWSAYLTLYSLELNANPEGMPRIYLNTNDLNALHDALVQVLPEDWVTFIIAYRQMGPYTNPLGTDSPTQSGATGTLNMDLMAQYPIVQVLDLVDVQVQYTFQGSAAPTIIASPFTSATIGSTLPTLMDYVTINTATTVPGRININQASATVLSGIPGITPDIVQQIIAQRSAEASADGSNRYETWLLAAGIVDINQMRTLMPFVTGGGHVYRAQVVGYLEGGTAASRAEVVFDATSPNPRILFWRDLSHLGRGYAVETLGVGFSR